MRPFVLAVLVLALAGCGDEPAPAAAPSDPPPAAMEGAPPPAWIETEGGPRWLGYSTFCWKGGCADYIAPACRDGHVPTIEVRRGERLRYHLGYQPSDGVTLTRFDGSDPDGRVVGAGADGEWTVDEPGAFALGAAAREGGDARYVACLVVSG